MPLPPLLFTRRDLLHAGGIAVAGSVLPTAFAAQTSTHAKAKSVIFLWLAGGVTHHESFDPKPDAPEEIRGTLSTIQTTLPGVRFAEVMPRMAKQTDKIALVRTFVAGTDDHFQAQVRALSGHSNSWPSSRSTQGRTSGRSSRSSMVRGRASRVTSRYPARRAPARRRRTCSTAGGSAGSTARS